MLNQRTTILLLVITVPLLLAGCISDYPETQDSPENDPNSEATDRQGELRPRGITVENFDNTSHHFNISIVKDGETLHSDNVSLSPDSETTIENVTSEEGVYPVTVRTEDGLSQQYRWRVEKNYYDLRIYYGTGLKVTQEVS